MKSSDIKRNHEISEYLNCSFTKSHWYQMEDGSGERHKEKQRGLVVEG